MSIHAPATQNLPPPYKLIEPPPYRAVPSYSEAINYLNKAPRISPGTTKEASSLSARGRIGIVQSGTSPAEEQISKVATPLPAEKERTIIAFNTFKQKNQACESFHYNPYETTLPWTPSKRRPCFP